MRYHLAARTALDADLERLGRDHLVVIELDQLIDLVRDPDVDPLVPRRGPAQAGVDDLAATLTAAERLPDDLTVRAVLPAGAPVDDPSVAGVEAALHRRAAYQATVSWREGMAQRAMGRRQLPLGLTIAVVFWALAYLAGYLATVVDGVAIGIFAVTAVILITIAWVVSWMVVESSAFDWRPGAREAAAYDLLSRARLEVTTAT